MTRERAKEFLPIIQGYAEGKEVEWQYRNDPSRDRWHHDPNPVWNELYSYRIKPEPPKPREWWQVMQNGFSLGVYECENDALNFRFRNNLDAIVIHVREVLP